MIINSVLMPTKSLPVHVGLKTVKAGLIDD